jgi:medium-chain acyl-[acyl-carrier-protein] hydrolase
MSHSWLFRMVPRSNPRLRLVCFPQAGKGPSMFNLWSKELPNTIEVCAVHLPGRESRINEPTVNVMSELVERLVCGLREALQGTFAIYGHSIGALIAFEFVRELRRRGQPPPIHLFVSGLRAPQCVPLSPTYQLNDQELVASITRRYGKLTQAILADSDVLSLFLRVVRADLMLMDTYHYVEEPPLAVPLAAYGGNRDATVDFSMIEAWRMHGSLSFRAQMFDGDHFFPDTTRAEVIRTIIRDLGPIATGVEGARA